MTQRLCKHPNLDHATEAGFLRSEEALASRETGLVVWGFRVRVLVSRDQYLGVSENRGPEYSTLNSGILITRTPK